MSDYDFATDLLISAHCYAAAGWPVFPLHSPVRSPRRACDCRDGDACRSPAKHPRLEHGLNDASTDEARIERWWHMWPRANVGVAVPHGYVVLDIDGMDGLDAIAAERWKIPETVTAATAHGWHHWFTTPDDVVVRPGTKFMPSIDMRGPGGYVVAPPSLHYTGVPYEWERSPVDCVIAPAPAWLFEIVKRARERRQHEPAGSTDGPIVEGGRNDTLTRIAGSMRRWGCSERAILAALEVTNGERCAPPLDDEELHVIASSVGRYQPEHFVPPVWERPDAW